MKEMKNIINICICALCLVATLVAGCAKDQDWVVADIYFANISSNRLELQSSSGSYEIEVSSTRDWELLSVEVYSGTCSDTDWISASRSGDKVCIMYDSHNSSVEPRRVTLSVGITGSSITNTVIISQNTDYYSSSEFIFAEYFGTEVWQIDPDTGARYEYGAEEWPTIEQYQTYFGDGDPWDKSYYGNGDAIYSGDGVYIMSSTSSNYIATDASNAPFAVVPEGCELFMKGIDLKGNKDVTIQFLAATTTTDLLSVGIGEFEWERLTCSVGTALAPSSYWRQHTVDFSLSDNDLNQPLNLRFDIGSASSTEVYFDDVKIYTRDGGEELSPSLEISTTLYALINGYSGSGINTYTQDNLFSAVVTSNGALGDNLASESYLTVQSNTVGLEKGIILSFTDQTDITEYEIGDELYIKTLDASMEKINNLYILNVGSENILSKGDTQVEIEPISIDLDQIDLSSYQSMLVSLGENESPEDGNTVQIKGMLGESTISAGSHTIQNKGRDIDDFSLYFYYDVVDDYAGELEKSGEIVGVVYIDEMGDYVVMPRQRSDLKLESDRVAPLLTFLLDESDSQYTTELDRDSSSTYYVVFADSSVTWSVSIDDAETNDWIRPVIAYGSGNGYFTIEYNDALSAVDTRSATVRITGVADTSLSEGALDPAELELTLTQQPYTLKVGDSIWNLKWTATGSVATNYATTVFRTFDDNVTYSSGASISYSNALSEYFITLNITQGNTLKVSNIDVSGVKSLYYIDTGYSSFTGDGEGVLTYTFEGDNTTYTATTKSGNIYIEIPNESCTSMSFEIRASNAARRVVVPYLQVVELW